MTLSPRLYVTPSIVTSRSPGGSSIRTRPCRSMSCWGVVASARASISRTFGSCAAISSRSCSESAWMCRTSASSISVLSKKSLTDSGAISGCSGSMNVGARIASSPGVASTGQVLTWQQPATPSSPRSSGETIFAPFSVCASRCVESMLFSSASLRSPVASSSVSGVWFSTLTVMRSRPSGSRSSVDHRDALDVVEVEGHRRGGDAELHAALDGAVLLAGCLQEAHLGRHDRADLDDELHLHAVEGVRLVLRVVATGRRSRTASAWRSSSRRACTGTARSPRTAASRRAARDATSPT